MAIISTYVNGRVATADDLAPLAFSGFAHFTAMQVRDGAVRGLDLHLDRLRTASDELFGHHLPDGRIRELLSSAVASAPPDVSLTCHLTTRPGEFLQSGGADEIDVLVTVADPVTPSAEPLALDVVPYQRHLPHIKHVGEVAKTRFLRRAAERGFDDAAFADPAGHLSEATIWNLAFRDGRTVVWPEAPVLRGVTMQIVERRLAARGVDQVVRPVGETELTAGLAGVVMNSWSPGVGLARIADTTMEDPGELVSLLHDAYESEPPVAV
ncbi:Branched-chain amino acid aminotransferase/4-amino-4-deoxychorismate lyase [Prauserella aidingensis]|uniref:aminotransferase class IV n=1 Tax=Prauserella aidingensis TaxID=387890 RepID=UPI0020A4DE7D|nr:aminotransferase class IV [Prauserella aidingensis]MCP2251610.1 Branched-chain amino acid aminotransferase/4-amino-4-deoxychorismate lyase [Prauserella aidingensis]